MANIHNGAVLLPQNPIQRPKKRTRKEIHWRKSAIKQAGILGMAHINRKGDVVPANTQQLLPCICDPPCVGKFTQPEIDHFYIQYRSLKSHEEQTLYLRGCILKCGEENNAFTNEYRVNPGTISVRVCQKVFLGLHGIKRSRLRKKVLNRGVPALDGRGRHANHPVVNPNAVLAVRTFLTGLNSRESHYSRKDNPNRTYLESSQSISSLYNDFILENPQFGPTAVRQQNEPPQVVRKWSFEKIFNYDFNISFGFPRSDICETCEKNSILQKSARVQNDAVGLHQLKQSHERHLDQAQKFYNAMSRAVIDALDQNVAAICFDFEKNLPLPVTNTSNEFYSRQLWIYNLGIHDLRTGIATMYMYSETFCQKGPNEVISSLRHYIDNFIPLNKTKLRIYSDDAGGQFKNRYLMGFLASLCDRFEEIKMFFPIVGHSRMACDRDFAHVEKFKKRHDKFHFPSDWINLIKRAQTSKPFRIIYLEHPLTDDLCHDGIPIAKVFDYKAVLHPLLLAPTGIRSKRGFVFNNVGDIMCRTETSGPYPDAFQILQPTTTVGLLRNNQNLAPPAYTGYIPVSKPKYDNLQELLKSVLISIQKIFFETVTTI